MVIRKWSIVCLCIFFLVGCSKHVIQVEANANEQQTIEQLLESDARIVAATAIVHDDQIVAGIRVNTFSRFTKRSIAKEVKKELEKEFPEKEVFVSPDNKVLYETTELLEKQDDKDVKKELEKILKLAKEET